MKVKELTAEIIFKSRVCTMRCEVTAETKALLKREIRRAVERLGRTYKDLTPECIEYPDHQQEAIEAYI